MREMDATIKQKEKAGGLGNLPRKNALQLACQSCFLSPLRRSNATYATLLFIMGSHVQSINEGHRVTNELS